MAEVRKIFGPPGTGKTTRLLSIVDDAIASGIELSRIGYFAFTRKASTEAKDRAAEKFGVHNLKTQLPYFRTLHSLAYHCAGVSQESIFTTTHLKQFAKQIGIELTATSDSEDDIPKLDNAILSIHQLAMSMGITLQEAYNRSEVSEPWNKVEYVISSYLKFKSANMLLDFADLLNEFVEHPERCPQLDVCVIDEAQDLSSVQWKIVDILNQNSKKLYIAGDDDQAIYNWAGADVERFLTYPGEVEVLDHSYRINRAVYGVANKIVNRIRLRQPKTWSPREDEGVVERYNYVEDLIRDIKADEEWLIMAPANYMLNPIHEELKAAGLIFERNHVKSISDKMLECVYGWESLRKGYEVPFNVVKNIYSYMSAEKIARGHKQLAGANPNETYNMHKLKEYHGMLVPDEPWYDALDKISEDKRVYMRAILRRGVKANREPRIKLSTIHSAKGGEADNVALLLDLSTKQMGNYRRDSDSINRMFYVGVTRARDNLYLITPKETGKAFHV